ncbi:MAG: DUF4065 domain-containing protein [Candidatus Thiodiazotropha sp. (ex Dulcina madagascariensis)]|nr:DUF4065 domain-containing protein [Candidatus Thiodiazotropha sp. (ex Dulcina madagascariensis)]MCU7927748.1 DUF4065 domain-containing protein [Candidatus Thiodiazotropha sp. (ex Dulcina madagascariensis)]
MLSALDVANYFLASSQEETGDLISNLKLQKLVYYAQGFYLAVYNEPLFDERIEAWTHGPVVPDLYHHFKKYEAGSIPPPEEFDFESFDEQVKDLLDEVNEIFGQYSAWKLRNLTHDEPPWANTYEKQENVITTDSMKEYFKTQLVNEQ